MKNEQLTELKKQLQNQLDELSTLQEINTEVNVDELSSVDNHPADSATELIMQTTEMAIDEFRDDEINDIKNAIEAIDNGTYGKCIECGAEIPYERLKAIPTTLTCVEHAE